MIVSFISFSFVKVFLFFMSVLYTILNSVSTPLEDIPSSLVGPSEHSSPSNRMNEIGASRAIGDVNKESVDVHFIFFR